MKIQVDIGKTAGTASPLLYGHFIEHFHRQIYSGIFDPGSPLADGDGFRRDVLEALRRIKMPILRWPGGCFVSAYHWKEAVGPGRQPSYDKAWRVEEPNTFGTDEYIRYCRKAGCEPYICTNAGTGTPEEMSDWVEYCNLEKEGCYARQRIANGSPAPHRVKYWSIGNENYGSWELGAKTADEWARFAAESAKMMLRVDPSIQLSAAALSDTEWNTKLLKACGQYLSWISIHSYWDGLWQNNTPAGYAACVAHTAKAGDSVRQVRGLLAKLGFQDQIKIAVDEWNLRGWHHPHFHDNPLGKPVPPEVYLLPRDLNDDNSTYTMADAVFTASFLNMALRNCGAVGMANFAPVVNTRGAVFTHPGGIVLRSTYFVFELYANLLGDRIVEASLPETVAEKVNGVKVQMLDMVAALRSSDGILTLAAVNKYDNRELAVTPAFAGYEAAACRVHTLNGPSTDSYNDIGHTEVGITAREIRPVTDKTEVVLPPHSVNVIEFLKK